MSPTPRVPGTPVRRRTAARYLRRWASSPWPGGSACAGMLALACLGGCGNGNNAGSDTTGPSGGGSIVAASPASLRQSVDHIVGAKAALGQPPPLPGLAGADDPAAVLGAARVVDNPYQPANRGPASPFPLVKVAAPAGPFPTSKWSKGFLYQTPADLTANFNNAPPWDPQSARNGRNDTGQESVIAYPNKLNLDDRVPLVSASFPRPRYIAPGIDPAAGIYNFNNRYLIDEVPYPIVASALADLHFAGSTGTGTGLVRSVVAQDQLSITTRWQSADAGRQMELVAALGSPFVTVRYQDLPAVIGVGQGVKQRYAKDPETNLPSLRNSTDPSLAGKTDPGTGKPYQEPIPDYSRWEVDNGLVAVAAGQGDLSAVASQPFVEATALDVKTPQLSGTAFRFVYRVPDPSRPTAPRTNNNRAPAEPLVNRVMNVYASAPITLAWDAASRTYVSTAPFNGTLRAVFVGEKVIADLGTDQPELLRFDSVERLLAAHVTEVPTAGHVALQYDGGATATLRFAWTTRHIDGVSAPDPSKLLMMALDATQTRAIRDATPTALGAASNLGRMTGMVGGTWSQAVPVPAILHDLPAGDSAKLWYGSGTIPAADRPRIVQELKREAADLQTFITHCNYDSYNCGKYIAQIGRLALIADQLGEADLRRRLVAFMQQNLNPWFDGADPGDPEIAKKTDPANPIFDYFIYDRTNGGLVTFRPYNRRDYSDDYYNMVYTDHMFHYGYFIYAAAVIVRLDEDPAKAWAAKYKPYVELLVRDVSNPSATDPYFPPIRMFDWFRGQNIADAGPTANGGNTESSSESIHYDYALALWADATGNATLKGLASVMTAVEIRSAQAFYQVTPSTSVFRDDREQAGVAPVTVTVQTPTGAQQRVLDPNNALTRGIVWAHISENNDFFGPRKAFLTGIQVLPVTPISEYVIGKAWAGSRAADIRALEDQLTANYTAAITEVPGPSRDCAVYAVRTPSDAKVPDTLNYGGGCAAAARKENAWRQVLVSLGGVNDPAATYDRFVQMVDLSKLQADHYTQVLSNPGVNPGSSTDANGSLPDLLRQSDTPSTNTNVLWWLSMLKSPR